MEELGTDFAALQHELSCSQTSTPDLRRVRMLLKRVMLLMSSGQDTQILIPSVVPLTASNDAVCKKMAYTFLSSHASNQELTLLSTNTFVRDCEDPNPMIRGMALRTLTLLSHELFADNINQQLMKGLSDRHPYVRRIAVLGCVKVHTSHPEMAETYELLDKLYSMIRDPDPIVATNTLNALESMLCKEGGVVINQNVAYYILNSLTLISNWGLVSIFSLLKKFIPPGQDDVYAIMNMIDRNFQSNSPMLVISALEYISEMAKEQPQLKCEVFQIATGQLVHIIAHGHQELNCALLDYLNRKMKISTNVSALQPHASKFFCARNDSFCVKTLKIAILPQLVIESNHKDVLGELYMYCSGSDRKVISHAIRAIATAAKNHPQHLELCIDMLMNITEKQDASMQSEVFQALQQFELSDYGGLTRLVQLVSQSFTIVTDTKGEIAMIWMLGEYGADLDETAHVVDTFIEDLDEDVESSVLIELITCVSKLFVRQPAQYHDALARLLERCVNHRRIQVKDHATHYFKLLVGDHLAVINSKTI